VDIRKGDADDPLAGVVRMARAGDRPVEVILGRGSWQTAILKRAVPAWLDDVEVPVAQAPDLVLLKLYAGGPQDRWDVVQLLGGDDRSRIAADVDHRISPLPARCRKSWKEIRREIGLVAGSRSHARRGRDS
jgi:hypothetical protein